MGTILGSNRYGRGHVQIHRANRGYPSHDIGITQAYPSAGWPATAQKVHTGPKPPPPPDTTPSGRPAHAAPYTSHSASPTRHTWPFGRPLPDSTDETWFGSVFNRAGRLWVVGGSFGGGLQGSELNKATVEDIEETTGGRLIVRTKGLKARLVPIRHAHTDLVREALDHAHNGRFIKTTGRNSVYRISSALDTGDGKGLSLRRARSTWLQAHLVAGTSLPALRWLAGSLSANTLAGLLPEAADLLDNETAVTEGLRA